MSYSSQQLWYWDLDEYVSIDAKCRFLKIHGCHGMILCSNLEHLPEYPELRELVSKDNWSHNDIVDYCILRKITLPEGIIYHFKNCK